MTSLVYAKQCKSQPAPSEVFQTWEFNYNKPTQSQAQSQSPGLSHKFIAHFKKKKPNTKVYIVPFSPECTKFTLRENSNTNPRTFTSLGLFPTSCIVFPLPNNHNALSLSVEMRTKTSFKKKIASTFLCISLYIQLKVHKASFVLKKKKKNQAQLSIYI